MEIVIVVAIWTVMVKRGVEDIWHTARGGTPPRLAAAKARRSTGAAGRYWSTLWDDTFDDLLARHTKRRARRQATPSTPRPRGAATEYFAGLFQDGRRTAHRKWDAAWSRKTVKRHLKRLRDSPGRQTVPGEVVPDSPNLDVEPPVRSWLLRRIGWKCIRCGSTRDISEVSKGGVFLGLRYCPRHLAEEFPDAGGPEDGDGPASPPDPSRPQDETEDGPQDGDGPDPRPDPDEDEDGIDLQDEPSQRDQDEDDEPPPCPKCGTGMTTAPNIGDPMSYDGKGIYRCPSCDYKIRRSPEPTDDFTQEGPTTMTATTTEVVGLDSAIRFCEDSARAYRAQIQAIEQTQAALAAGEVTGPAAETFSQAMEQSSQAAASMDAAAAELLRHKQVQEAYNANQGAGNRDFILAGQ